MGRNQLCPQAPPRVPLPGAAVLKRSQRTPWPGLLIWMGWGSVLSWLQKATKGQPKQTPGCLGISAATEVPHRTEGQCSPLFPLQVSPAAKETRAKPLNKSHQASPPGSSQRCPPATEHKGEMLLGNQGPLEAQLSPAVEKWGWMHMPCRKGSSSLCSTSACLQEE